MLFWNSFGCISPAASLTWDANGSAAPNPSDGSGVWLTSSNWRSSTANVNWNNVTPDSATFGTGTTGTNAYTVDLGGAVTVGSLTFENQNYTITGTSTLSVLGGVTADADATITSRVIYGNPISAKSLSAVVASGKTLLISGSISGANTSAILTKSGGGTLVLSGSNSYAARTQIAAGTLELGNVSALQGSTLDLYSGDSGSLSFGVLTSATFGNLTGARPLILQNSGSTSVSLSIGSNNQSQTYTGKLSGSGSITKAGSGRLTLTGTNIYTGPTTLAAGELQARDGLGLSSSSNLVMRGGVLQGSGSTSFTRSLGPGAGQIQWTGTGGFGASGGRMVVLLNNSNSAPLAWGSTPYFVGDSGYLRFGFSTGDSQVEFQNDIDLNGAARTIFTNNISGGESALLSGVLSGSGSSGIIKEGNSTLFLTANNTYTGATTINNGILQATDGAGLPSASNLVLNGGIFQSSGTTSQIFNRSIGTGAGQVQWKSGGFAASGGKLIVLLNNSNASPLVRGPSTGFNPSTLSFGSLTADNQVEFQNDINAQDTLLQVSVTAGVGGDSALMSGVISNTASAGLYKLGNGTLILRGNNIYSGETNIQSGTLQANDGAGLPANSNLNLAGGVLQSDGVIPVSFTRTIGSGSNQVVLSGGGFSAGDAKLTVLLNNSNATPLLVGSGTGFSRGFLTFGSPSARNQVEFQNDVNLNGNVLAVGVTAGAGNDSALMSGILSGTLGSGFTKYGDGRLILSATNTYSGVTQIDQGVLQANDGVGLSPNSNLYFQSGINTGAVLQSDGTTPVSFIRSTGTGAGQIHWSSLAGGGFSAKGAKLTVLLNNSNSTPLVWGSTDFNPYLFFGSPSADNQVDFQNNIDLNASTRNIIVYRGIGGDSALLSGTLSGAGGIQKTGDGLLIFSASNTYTWDTYIYGGSLQLGNGGNTGSIAPTGSVLGTSTNALVFNRSDAVTFPNTVYFAKVEQVGSGTTTLTGTSTTIASATVRAGVLNVDGELGSGVSLANGAMLGGKGKISGAVAGGIVSPGASAGILTIGSITPSVDVSGTSFTRFAFEFTKTGAPVFNSAASSGNDLLHVTSTTGPFTAALSRNNEINVYFNLASGVNAGNLFLGGFFTDRNVSFLSSIQNATFRYFITDPAGATIFNGVNYRPYTENSVVISSVAQAANFGGGTVNGQILQMQVVPEPNVSWLLAIGVAGLMIRRRCRAVRQVRDLVAPRL